jgi:hypothetical protein
MGERVPEEVKREAVHKWETVLEYITEVPHWTLEGYNIFTYCSFCDYFRHDCRRCPLNDGHEWLCAIEFIEMNKLLHPRTDKHYAPNRVKLYDLAAAFLEKIEAVETL